MAPVWVDIPGGEYLLGLTRDEAARLARISSEVREAHLEDDPDRVRFFLDRERVGTRPQRRRRVGALLAELAPARTVAIGAFQMAKAPVTHAEFAAFCRATAREWTPPWGSKPEDAVVGVTWEDAAAYAAWAGARLPAAEEWERAARGPRRWLFPWGNDWSEVADRLMDRASLAGWPPGSLEGLASPEGVLDLVTRHGEWCAGEFRWGRRAFAAHTWRTHDDATFAAATRGTWHELRGSELGLLIPSAVTAIGAAASTRAGWARFPSADTAAGAGAGEQPLWARFRLARDAPGSGASTAGWSPPPAERAPDLARQQPVPERERRTADGSADPAAERRTADGPAGLAGEVPEAVQALFDAMVAEAHADRAFDSEFSPSPYDPRRFAGQLAAHGKRALPLLMRALRSGGELEAGLARDVLQAMGPVAAPEAVEPLAQYTRTRDPYGVLALWAVSQDAVVERGLHRLKGPRQALAHHLGESHLGEVARLLGGLFDDPDDDVARFALAGDEFESPWNRVALHRPELVPVARLRELASSPRRPLARAPAVVDAALEVLAFLHRAEDVPLALGRAAAGRLRLSVGAVEWLAAHPDSLVLLDELLKPGRVGEGLVQLVRRRRCAGLTTPAERLRPLVRRELAMRSTWHRDLLYFDDAVALATELKDAALVDDLVAALAHPRWYSIHGLETALRVLGPESIERLAAERRRARGEHLKAAEGMLETLRRPEYAPKLAHADQRFLQGAIENTIDAGAWRGYAAVLLRHEDSAHAAFQLAWIDRAFGSAVTPQRVAWIRALGCRDEALLATLLAAPEWTVPGHRFLARPSSIDTFSDVAAWVARAGLPSVAAEVYRHKEQRDAEAWRGPRERAEAAAQEHLERVRAACAR